MKTNIPKYCLHIIESYDRKYKLEELKSKYDIFNDMKICEFTKVHINTVIGNMLTSMHDSYYDELLRNNPDVYGSAFSCAYNWLQIIKCAYERGDEFAFFIEDDIDVIDNIDNDILNNMVADIPDDADIVKVYRIPDNFLQDYDIIGETKYFNKVLSRKNTFAVSVTTTFQGYSRRAMKYIIDRYEQTFKVADMMYEYPSINDLNIYMIKQNMFCTPHESIIKKSDDYKIQCNVNTSCGLANVFFMVFSKYKYFDIKRHTFVVPTNISKYAVNVLEQFGCKIEFDSTINWDGKYYQDVSLFNLDHLRNQLIIPKEIRSKIITKIPDITKRCVIHVRRGDFLHEYNYPFFVVQSANWIKSVYNKYYKDTPVFIVSNDINWCKENLSDLCNDVVFSGFNDAFTDFCSIVLGKCIIASASSFSMFATYLNKNNDCVCPYPFYKVTEWNNDKKCIIPEFVKLEQCDSEMLKTN